uniref:ribonuclease H n=1 Tax=Amphiprion ocellaris TaxID=80972 RepID=A0AAQ5X3D5_AMPOC
MPFSQFHCTKIHKDYLLLGLKTKPTLTPDYPQGFTHSPTMYSQALQMSMSTCPNLTGGQMLLYVDDILVTGNSQEQCKENTLVVLKHLYLQGHKVSQHKLQCWTESVRYLGHIISAQGKQVTPERKEAVLATPKPKTKQQMMSFLGLCNFCRTWIPDYSKLAQPLQNLIYGKQLAMNAQIEWTDEGNNAFQHLKQQLASSSTLATPNYDKPFALMVSNKDTHMTAVLTQRSGDRPRPIAFYSKKLDPVASGLPHCVQACVAIAEAIHASAEIVLLHPLTVYIEHSVEVILLQTPLPFLTTSRHLGLISRLLSHPHIVFKTCKTISVSQLVATPVDGTSHSCEDLIKRETKPRPDISETPQCNQKHLFVDGSAQKDCHGRNRVGYAVTTSSTVLEAGALLSSYSAQTAELHAVTRACKISKGQDVCIWTDSQYVHDAVHHFSSIWSRRGLTTATGKPLTHSAKMIELLQAVLLPKSLSLCKCAAHQTDESEITKGNNLADETAKVAALAEPHCENNLLTMTNIDIDILQDAQKTAPIAEQKSWQTRGAITKDNILYIDNKPILPKSLHATAALVSHGKTHVSTGGMVTLVNRHYYAINFESSAKQHISKCMICLKHNSQGNTRPKRGRFPTPPHPFHTIHMDFIELTESREGKYALVIICAFSKWVEIYPLKKNDALNTAKCLVKHYIPTYGVPKVIRSDNGTHFVNEVIKLTAEALGIELKNHCAYHPQSAGLVERTNGTIKSRLRKTMEETGRPWNDCVCLVKMWMRITRSDTGLTPFEVVYGRIFPLPQFNNDLDKSDRETRLADYMKKKMLNDKEIQSANTVPQNPISHQQKVKPGDWVLIKVFQRRSWSAPKWEGPYQVLLTTPTAIKIAERPSWIHLTHCKLVTEAVKELHSDRD